MTSFLKMHGLGNDFVIFDARIFSGPDGSGDRLQSNGRPPARGSAAIR